MYFPVGTTQEFPRDEVTYLLSELARLKDEMDKSYQRWTKTWSDLDIKNVLKRQSKAVNETSFYSLLSCKHTGATVILTSY